MKFPRPAAGWLRKRPEAVRNDTLDEGFRHTPVARFDLFSLAVRSMR